MFLVKYNKDHRDTKFIVSANWSAVQNKHTDTLVMHKAWKEKLHVFPFVRSANLFVFEDTGAKSLTVIFKVLGNVRGDRIFVKSLDKYHLRAEVDGTLTITKNKRLVYTSKGLRDALDVIALAARDEPEGIIEGFLKDSFKIPRSPYDTSYPIDNMMYHYRISRNKNLKDLPWDDSRLYKLYFSPTEDLIKARAKMNGYLRKGDTKNAVKACFYSCNFPKSINKMLIELGPFKLNKEVYKSIEEAVKVSGVDKVRELLKSAIADGTYHLISKTIFEFLERGFNIPEISYRVFDTCNDILRMESIPSLDTSNINPGKNLTVYHDTLALCLEEIRKKGDPKTKLFENNSIYKPELEWETPEYIFKSPKYATELSSIGKSLRNCVGSYASDAYTNRLNIMVLKNKEGKNLVCIELRHNHIVQAKLNKNLSVKENPEILQVIKEWAQEKDLVLNSYDVSEGSYEYMPPPDPEIDKVRAEEIYQANLITRNSAGRYRNQEAQRVRAPALNDLNMFDLQEVVGEEIPF